MDKSSRSDPGPSPSPSLYPLGLAAQVFVFEFVFLFLSVFGSSVFAHPLFKPTSVGTNTIQVELVVTRGNGKGILGIRALVFTIDILTVMFFVCIL